MKTLFTYILGESLVLDVVADVTKPTSTNLNCEMGDAVEANGWEADIRGAWLPSGETFYYGGLSLGEESIEDLLEQAAIEAYGE